MFTLLIVWLIRSYDDDASSAMIILFIGSYAVMYLIHLLLYFHFSLAESYVGMMMVYMLLYIHTDRLAHT